ncbi:MAG: MotA/TolQ/ExbB proton channel family protein [Bacillota bacterium]
MNIPGSEYLTIILHALAQTMLIPVLVGLLAMAIFIFIEFGSLMGEKQARSSKKDMKLIKTLYDVDKSTPWQMQNLRQAVENGFLKKSQKDTIYEFLAKKSSGYNTKVLMKDILDQEEYNYLKILNRTDLVCKLGPVLGLMGTLIPLGPGLAALGQGDIKGLSEAVIIAFDTTVLGVAVGAVGLMISKVRRGWYQKDMNYFENLLELIEGSEWVAGEDQEKKNLYGSTRK